MAEFRLRMWQEQTLFDCNDYIVEADTLEEAVELLQEKQEEANEHTGMVYEHVTHDAITRLRYGYYESSVEPLDPEEVVAGDSGVTLIDEDGNRVRDLISVPTGCVQLGSPLCLDDPEDDISPSAVSLLPTAEDE